MAHAEKYGTPHEIELGGIRISGLNPTPVIAQIKSFLDADGSGAFEAAPSVHALLDASALEVTNGSLERASVLVLDLDSIELVRLSGDHHGPIRWFSLTDPREKVGRLLDRYRGTYYRASTRELIYSSDSGREVYPLPDRTKMTAALLAAVCVAREVGISEAAIRRALATGMPGISTSEIQSARSHRHEVKSRNAEAY